MTADMRSVNAPRAETIAAVSGDPAESEIEAAGQLVDAS